MRQLSRRFGLDCLHKVGNIPNLRWVIPREARQTEVRGSIIHMGRAVLYAGWHFCQSQMFSEHVHVNPHTHKPVELCYCDLKSSTNIHVTPRFLSITYKTRSMLWENFLALYFSTHVPVQHPSSNISTHHQWVLHIKMTGGWVRGGMLEGSRVNFFPVAYVNTCQLILKNNKFQKKDLHIVVTQMYEMYCNFVVLFICKFLDITFWSQLVL